MTTRPFPSPLLVEFKRQFQFEYVSDLGPPFALHARGGKHRAGEFVERAQRIFDGHHILWAQTKDGPVAIEWRQPYHEAVKRLAPSWTDTTRLTARQREERRYLRERWRWLRVYLLWRGQPCVCNHGDIVEHIALIAKLPRLHVERAIEQAVRRADTIYHERPLAISGRTG